jgi:hypothetical protein
MRRAAQPGGAPRAAAGRPAAVLACAVLLAAGCAVVPVPAPSPGTGEPPTIAFGRFEFAGQRHDTEWHLPAAAPVGLVLVQHGFARRCANLRTTARRLAEAGAMTLCVNAEMTGGSPALADALAAAILQGLTAPDGREVPPRVVVAGHSAGAVFAARVGRALAWAEPSVLAGAILFDPVAVPGFAENLEAIADGARRPVFAVMAARAGCNAGHNALPALRGVADAARAAGGDGFVGVELGVGSTHVDAEGEDTEWAAVLACRQGAPTAANTEVLRTLAARWAVDLLGGVREADAYPGRPYLDGLLAGGHATSLTAGAPR